MPSDAPLLHSGFVEHAGRSPDATALTLEGRSWTYGELDGTARLWAAAILDAVGRRPERVAVFGSRSEVSYAGVLAALFAGAAFVPLSPQMPAERTRRMLASAAVDAVLVDDSSLSQVAEVITGGFDGPVVAPTSPEAPALPVPALTRRDVDRSSPLDELPAMDAGSTAYLLFTSGSTGAPKGVPISHANARSFLDAASRRYGIGPRDRLSQTFDQVFDLSVFDLFVAWSGGARVCSPRPIDLLSPFRYVEQHGITLWFSVPSLATLLRRKRLLRPGSLPSLRWSLFCGEALVRSTAEAWQAAAPGSTLENLYGPTEATIACTAYRWDPERSPGECVDGLVPIGHPFDGVQTVVLDESLEPVDDDRPGELCVGGAQTFDGYWRDPAATERAFVERRGVRSYRTGDRVRALPGAGLAFVGRLDHQVQVMGHRVELGEVEAALRTADGVVEAVALPQGGAAGSAEGIVAFVTGTPAPEAALRHVRSRLPGHAVPRAIHVLDALPLNPNGKVDRGALRRSANEEETGREAGL